MTLALAQFGSGTDKGKNLDAIRSFAQQAAKSGASMPGIQHVLCKNEQAVSKYASR